MFKSKQGVRKTETLKAKCPCCEREAEAVLLRDTDGMCHAGELTLDSLKTHAWCDIWGLLVVLQHEAARMSMIKINKVVGDDET
jgi:hypothetical protein